MFLAGYGQGAAAAEVGSLAATNPQAAGTKAGNGGRGRTANGLVGGNWPSTARGKSGGNRGNATPSGTER